MDRRQFGFGMFSLLGSTLLGCRGEIVFQATGRKSVAKALEESRLVEFLEMDAGLTNGQFFRGLVVVAAENEHYPFYKGRGEQLFVSVNGVAITASVENIRVRGGDTIELTPTSYDRRLVR